MGRFLRFTLALVLSATVSSAPYAATYAPMASIRPRLRPRAVSASIIMIRPAGLALAPTVSPRPRQRLGGTVADVGFRPRVVRVPVYYHARIRPRPRPGAASGFVAIPLSASGSGLSPRQSPRPRPRRTIHSAAARAQAGTAGTTRQTPWRGRVRGLCGDPGIRGRRLAPIRARLPGCGVSRPVQVISVDGVKLSRPATMTCTTARALNSWVRNGVKPTIDHLGGGLASLQVAAGYSCRTRNNRKGGRISEHGKGKAIDISAFRLVNGISLDVKTGWRDPLQGKLLRRFHDEACGPFGTVLGPAADRYHRDHFHLDTARYRGGPYCR